MATVKAMDGQVLRPGESIGGLHDRFGAGGLFRNENLDLLSKLLDTWFRVPGTNLRFGLDGIIGFVPGIGDFLAGAASCIIVLAAFSRGVPVITVARMVANLGIEVVVGIVPVLGTCSTSAGARTAGTMRCWSVVCRLGGAIRGVTGCLWERLPCC